METDITGYRAPGRISVVILFAAITIAFSVVIDACRTEGSMPLNWINGDTVRVYSKHGITTFNNRNANGIIFYLNSAGDTMSRIPFINGKEQGEAKFWYNDQHVKELRYYSDGKKTGTHHGWYADGSLRFEYNYTADEFNGTYKEWYASGQLFRNQNFKMGHEDGMQTIYFEGGQIKSNYLIKNNRRYGLPGTQNCVNISDTPAP